MDKSAYKPKSSLFGPPRPGLMKCHVKKTRLESLGIYLPDTILTTAELLRELKQRPRWNAENITGIRERRVALQESGFEVCVAAVHNALKISRYRPEDLDVIISIGPTSFDIQGRHQYEPCLSALIKAAINAGNAMHFDIANDCAGMFSGITIIDSMIRNSEVTAGLVVSAELPFKAFRIVDWENEDALDSTMACLTLGDAGAAVILDGNAQDGIGFHYINLSTCSRYCTPYMLRSPAGVLVRSEPSEHYYAVLSSILPRYKEALDQTGWSLKDLNVFIPHQVSRNHLRKWKEIIRKGFGENVDDVFIDNLERYGNTGSTSNFVAMHEYMLNGRIGPGCNILFGIHGSGFVMGMATCTMDDLPLRYRISHEKGASL